MARVTHQVKYLGLLENIRVRRAGFAFRERFERFVTRYQWMLPANSRGGNPKALAGLLLQNAEGVAANDWQLGVTKVFVRKPETLFKFEEMREEHIQLAATKIQKFVNQCLARSIVRALRYQGALLVVNKKQRRRESLYRPFVSDYCRYSEDPRQQETMKDYLEHPLLAKGGRRARTQSMYSGQEKVVFTEPNVNRLFSSGKSLEWETGPFYLSNQALYTIGTVTRKDKSLTTIRCRIAVRDIQRVSLSSLSDCVVCIHVAAGVGSLTGEPLSKKEWMPNAAANACMQTGVKFTLTARRSHCRFCGRVFHKDCLNNLVTLRGLPKKEKVCDTCYGLTLQEDQVLVIDHKVEFLFRLNQEYQATTGRTLPIDFSDSTQVTRRLGDDTLIQITSVTDNTVPNAITLLTPPSSITVKVPAGLSSSILPTEVSSEGTDHVASLRRPHSVNQRERLQLVQSHALHRVSMRMGEEEPAAVCKALYDYEAQEDDYLSIKAGDIITLTNKDDSGWWEGELNGKSGFFPSNYVEEIAPPPKPKAAAPPPQPRKQNPTTTTTSLSPAAASSTTTTVGGAPKAVSSGGGWSAPKPADAPKANLVMQAAQPPAAAKPPAFTATAAPPMFSPSPQPPQQQQQPAAKAPGKIDVSALGGFAMPGMGGAGGPPKRPPRADNTASGGGGGGATETNEQLTRAPFNPLAGLGAQPPAPRQPKVEQKPQCRALFDYEATEDEYMSIRAGDIIDIVTKDDSGWWEGKFNGKQGFFPSNYVEEITAPAPTSTPTPPAPSTNNNAEATTASAGYSSSVATPAASAVPDLSSVKLTPAANKTAKPAAKPAQAPAQDNTVNELAAKLAKRRAME
eukprot:c20764_g1_i3.p1 GENE.c20764_g1_i3~~c20764_g1_i3.p1  ORF type:complete len:851 (+),score=192.87 c20764_g1_i3:64-2616(+)